MNNVIEILKKPMLTVYEGELVGSVSTCYLDKYLKKIVWLQVTSEDGEEHLVSFDNIYNIGVSAIIIKNKGQLINKADKDISALVTAPIGCRVYSMEGEYKGKLANLNIKNAHGIISNFVLDNETPIDIERVASAGKNSVIIKSENTTIRISSFRRSAPKQQPEREQSTVTAEATAEPVITNPVVVGATRPTSVAFMLGKYCTKDILGLNNYVIIQKGTRITNSTVSAAVQHGKLKELMLFFD